MIGDRALKLLSDAQIASVHATSLEILQEIGVELPHQGLLDLFRENGADVDARRSRVRIPPALVESSVKKQVENNERHYGSDPCSFEALGQLKGWMSLGNLKTIVDYGDGSARNGSVRDVLESIVIANALPNIERVGGFVEPGDVDRRIVEVVLFYLLCLFSAKRFFLVPVTSFANARCMINMARFVADNETQLRSGKLLEYELEPIANLEFSPEHLQIAWEFARQKLKVFVGHYCFMGKDAPADYLSTITLTNANILAAITAVMLMNPDHFGVDYVFAAHGIKSSREPRPLFGAPHQAVFAMAARQLADLYNFRYSLANTGLSDSCSNDFQSGFERGVTAAISALCGNSGFGLQGIVGADQAVSLDELIIDDGLIGYLNHILRSKSLMSSRAIDFQSIRDTGIGGTFLDRMDTTAGYRELAWSSPIFSTETFGNQTASPPERGTLVRKLRQDLLARSFPPKAILPKDRADRLTTTVLESIEEPEAFRKFLGILEHEVPGAGARV
jgi:trimethylamine--corrinoid protein Co-methyltransferase